MSKHHQNIVFTHSGGVTTVVNQVAYTLHQRAHQDNRMLYIPKYGIHGILNNDYICASNLTTEWPFIQHTPGSSFGSSRIRLPDNIADFEIIFKQFDQMGIGWFFCNGGNNSQCITRQITKAAQSLGYPLQCIGIPKTIDNDILHTDTCPGFGSAAKYTATSIYEMSIDLQAMCYQNPKIIIYETMGRDAGWLAASSALASTGRKKIPHIILLPEASFSLEAVANHVMTILKQEQHCVIIIAEGALDQDKKLTGHDYKSIYLSQYLHQACQVKTRIIIPDYLQRAARHLCSKTDVEQTIAVTHHAYDLALKGENGIMASITRACSEPYQWSVSSIGLSAIAGKVKMLPPSFLRDDHLYVSDECLQHLRPLIQGELYPSYKKGIPYYKTII